MGQVPLTYARDPHEMTGRYKRRRKITEDHYVDLADCIPFENKPDELPYLRCVKLKMSKPTDFDLTEGWTRKFTIPNRLMKRIYSNEIYIDNEVEIIEEPRVEEFRREILNNYLNYRSYPPKLVGLITSRYDPPLDELLECLDEVYEEEKRDENKELVRLDNNLRRRLKATGAVELNQDNIAVCRKHKIQPEENIVRIALTKVNDLNLEEEKKLRNLLLDEGYMNSLQRVVEIYLRGHNLI